MFKSLIALAALFVLISSTSAKAAILWQNIDPDFQIINGLDTNSADPKVYSIQVKNTSATNYTNVHLIVPFHWTVDQIPATTASASTWDNMNARWINGTDTFQITNYVALTKMSDTDITPYTVNEPTTGLFPATIGVSDSVPNLLVGNLNAGQTVSFNVVIDFTPGFVPSEFVGYFVQAVPEPSTIGLFAISAFGLLFRRR